MSGGHFSEVNTIYCKNNNNDRSLQNNITKRKSIYWFFL